MGIPLGWVGGVSLCLRGTALLTQRQRDAETQRKNERDERKVSQESEKAELHTGEVLDVEAALAVGDAIVVEVDIGDKSLV